ncbi:MAG: hypothetical protein KDC69_01825 [Flavobacteriaceae bacterium]|nr:hypothetical protein [Flavobacteriaceae bacterium]
MKNQFDDDSTYVLFGREAIELCKISLELLLLSVDVKFKIGAYNDVKDFVSEAKKWNGFLEISKSDYHLLLKKIKLQEKAQQDRERRKKSILRFFK